MHLASPDWTLIESSLGMKGAGRGEGLRNLGVGRIQLLLCQGVGGAGLALKGRLCLRLEARCGGCIQAFYGAGEVEVGGMFGICRGVVV